MEILLWIYVIGLTFALGLGAGLALLGAMFGIGPSDKTVLKWIGYSIAWPITYPALIVREQYR